MSELLSGRLKARLKAGDAIGLIWLSLGHPTIAEMAAHSGADAVVIDLQHGLWDRASFEAAVGVSARAVAVIARVADNSSFAIGSALDAGTDGVLVPMVETAEQAAVAVAAGRFPPHGHRSGGGVRPLAMGFGAYLKKADSIAIGVMIETVRGVDNADAIAATPGLDFILIGTGDLGISYASGRADQRTIDDGCDRVRSACKRAGVACGIFTASTQMAVQRRDEAYQLVVLANDVDAINGAFASAAKNFADAS